MKQKGAAYAAPFLSGFVQFVSGHFIKGRVVKIDIFCIHLFLAQPHTFTEALEVHNFALSQESDYVIDIRIV